MLCPSFVEDSFARWWGSSINDVTRNIVSFFLCFETSKTSKRIGNFFATTNFIYVLRAAFTREDPKCPKKTVESSVFFALLGPISIKAAGKMLVKSTPGTHSSNDLLFKFRLFKQLFSPHPLFSNKYQPVKSTDINKEVEISIAC